MMYRFFLCSLAASTVWGAASVAPIRVELSDRQHTAIITVQNTDSTEQTYQLEPCSWTQHDGADKYEATSDLIAVPPVFRLKPGGSQVIRVGIEKPALVQETAFRLYITEMAPRKREGEDVAIQTLLRIGIPVFVKPNTAPGQKAAPQLKWALSPGNSDKRVVRIENPTNVHIQVGSVRIGNAEPISAGFYLLPGQHKDWTISSGPVSTPDDVTIEAETDQGRLLSHARVGTL